MATVRQEFTPESAVFPSTNFAPYDRVLGTNFSVGRLLYDAAADEAAFWKSRALAYGSGNWTIHLDWYAVNATSGVVRWGAALAAITPDTDSQDVETKAFGTESTVDDTHLGTTGKRLHRAVISGFSNLDSLAAEDVFWLRIRRIGSNGSDTMANDAALALVTIEYSDT